MELNVECSGLEAVSRATYTLSRGYSPGIITLTVTDTGEEFIPPRIATITITDGERAITLNDCRLVDVTKSGAERTLQFQDERWKVQTLVVVSERWNIIGKTGVPGELEDVETEKTPAELAERLSPGITGTENLNENLRPQVIWDYTNRYEALTQLCEASGCSLVWHLDNTWSIHKTGEGVTELDTTYARSSQKGERLARTYGRVLAVSAPSLRQVTLNLEAVAKDIDGYIKPLADLSYMPSGNILDTFYFAQIANEEERKLAVETLFRWYRIKYDVEFYGGEFSSLHPLKWIELYNRSAISLRDLLPLPGGDINEEGGESITDSPGIVEGTYRKPGSARGNTTGKIQPGLWTLDTALGIVKFTEQIFKLSSTANPTPVEAELKLQTFVTTNRMEVSRELPSGDDGTFEQLIKKDDIQPIYNQYGVELTGAEAKLIEYAEAEVEALSFEASNQSVVSNGIHDIELDGAVEQVSWTISTGDSGDATTEASVNLEHSPYIPPHKARRARERLNTANAMTEPGRK